MTYTLHALHTHQPVSAASEAYRCSRSLGIPADSPRLGKVPPDLLLTVEGRMVHGVLVMTLWSA